MGKIMKKILDILFGTSTPAHKDLCYQFNLGNRVFEAVGFLKRYRGEAYGEKALESVDNGLIVSSDEDWEYICRHSEEFPSELNKYWLATARPVPGKKGAVSCLTSAGAEKRKPFHYFLNLRWYDSDLILRRCPN